MYIVSPGLDPEEAVFGPAHLAPALQYLRDNRVSGLCLWNCRGDVWLQLAERWSMGWILEPSHMTEDEYRVCSRLGKASEMYVPLD